MEWQTIESAPKAPRGTEILLCSVRDIYYCAVGQWAEADPTFGSVSGWFWPFANKPTHWMPLPKPPELLTNKKD